jgi:hypothetical protein|nr:MAG TPA: hypothetical protein [Caudoviricetes sp.]
MANYGIKIDLLKLRGSFMRNLQGKTVIKRCLIIPVDDCDGIFVGEKGCYLNMTAIEMREARYTDTHCIKENLPKEQREALSEDERNALPILGGMHALETKQGTMKVNGTLGQEAFATDDDDLPF